MICKMSIVESSQGYNRESCAIKIEVDCSGSSLDIQQCPFWSAKSRNESAHARKVPTNIPLGMIEEM